MSRTEHYFDINNREIYNSVQSEGSIAEQLSRIKSEVLNIGNSLGFHSASRHTINGKISQMSEEIDKEKRAMVNMRDSLQDILELYSDTEERIYNHVSEKNVSENKENLYGTELSFASAIPWIDKMIGPGGQQPRGTISTGFSEEYDIHGSLISGAFDYQSDDVQMSGSYSVGAYDAYAKAYGNLFTVNENGDRILSLDMGAEIGASYTALQANGEAVIGTDMLGAYVEGDVTIGKVSGQAEAGVRLMDENGNFNPKAAVSASAEAILVEGSVTAGTKVFGTDIGVEAGVNIGIGAHADAGYEDGVFTLDIGASFGIGASVKLEIDIGGTIDAVSGFAESIFEKIWKW